MRQDWRGGNKWHSACQALTETADSISRIPGVETALRVFGHLYHEPDLNCRDTRLEVNFAPNNASRIRQKLQELRPRGITPLVYAIEKAATDFGEFNGAKIIIVITDGEDACDRDICSARKALEEHRVWLRPIIIGMNVQKNVLDNMSCLAKTVATYAHDEFRSALQQQTLSVFAQTTLQVNLNDEQGKPTETDVSMSFYDMADQSLRYEFYHTLNYRGQPDTLVLSPQYTYRLVVHTLPPITKDSIVLAPNRHHVLNLHAPQGYIKVMYQQQGAVNKHNERIQCLVSPAGSKQTIYTQRILTTEKYLTGTYDVDVLTLPVTSLKGVRVEQSKTTEIFLPAPGTLTLNKSFDLYGAIFAVQNNRLVKIYDLHPRERQEIIAIQPGKYRLVYRAKNARTIHTTVDKEFEIQSGGSLSLKL